MIIAGKRYREVSKDRTTLGGPDVLILAGPFSEPFCLHLGLALTHFLVWPSSPSSSASSAAATPGCALLAANVGPQLQRARHRLFHRRHRQMPSTCQAQKKNHTQKFCKPLTDYKHPKRKSNKLEECLIFNPSRTFHRSPFCDCLCPFQRENNSSYKCLKE